MQDWQVWTIWYDDRLDGRVRDEERELAYVRIEEALWDQGPAIINAEIRKRPWKKSFGLPAKPCGASGRKAPSRQAGVCLIEMFGPNQSGKFYNHDGREYPW
jgi:hypothetical protein